MPQLEENITQETPKEQEPDVLTSEPIPENAQLEQEAAAEDDKVEPTPEAEATENEDAGDDKAENPKKAAKPRKDGMTHQQRRLKRLHAEREKAEREAAYWRGVAEAREAAVSPPTDEASAKETPEPRPKVGDYENYEDFTEALTDWKIEQREMARNAQAPEAPATPEPSKLTPEQDERLAKAAVSIMDKGREQFEDFDDLILDPGTPVTEAMISALDGTDRAHEVLYHLAQDSALIARIAGLSPAQAAREIGKFEAQLNFDTGENTKTPNPNTASSTKPKTQVSNAPEPVTPVGGSSPSDSGLPKSPEKMSQAEYEAWRLRSMRLS